MRLRRFWLFAIGITLLVLVGGIVVTLEYLNQGVKPLPTPKDEATRRAAQRERTADDFTQIASYYSAYCSQTKDPNSTGFWEFLNGQEGARTICAFIKEQQYAVHVPVGGKGLIAFERDIDHDGTRVVVMADGKVNKHMLEAEFQEICPDRFRDRTAKP